MKCRAGVLGNMDIVRGTLCVERKGGLYGFVDFNMVTAETVE